jgi:peptidyl-tRNA hydrolase, PTH1 family
VSDNGLQKGPKLIVGLGNFAHEYQWTRHNIGMIVAKSFAEQHHFPFHHERGCEAHVAKGCVEERNLIIAMPTTFMNETGRPVSRLLKFFGLGPSDLLVLVDDIETSWGQMKLAFSGGTRGHNGLRSIHGLIGTKEFTQLRIGVGRPGSGSVAEFVLQRFRREEMEELQDIADKAFVLMEEWIKQ